MYGLLHDIGHLPLSHVFELAFEDYLKEQHPDLTEEAACAKWFGVTGFQKLHEACGAALVRRVLVDVRTPGYLKVPLVRLMTEKTLPKGDPLAIVKHIIDSEIDADRIDSTARDGLLAGGEYGTYDVERLCSAVFLHQTKAGTWRICYSAKALGSIEALLFDRYRTHTWIHFHHRVVAFKRAASTLIKRLLVNGDITKDSFPVDEPRVMALRDDIWLWSLIRSNGNSTVLDSAEEAAREALLHRDKKRVRLLWKRRREYHDLHTRLKKEASTSLIKRNQLGRDYALWLSEQLGTRTSVFWLRFAPITEDVLLTEDDGQSVCGNLQEFSHLARQLNQLWEGEPQYYVILLGGLALSEADARDKWVELTAAWLERAS